MLSLSQLRQTGTPRQLLLLAALVFVGQVLGLWWGAQSLRQAEAQLATTQRSLTMLEKSQPAPTRATAAALAADIATTHAALAEAESPWRANAITRALLSRADAAGEPAPPHNRRAAYFDLSRYRQRMIRLAQEHGVELGTAPQLGFGEYANEGPEVADIFAVYRQRLVFEQVVSALLRSRPHRLLAVIRASASAEVSLSGVEKWGEAAEAHMPPPESVARDTFQIRFRGRTAALRDWLNALAALRLPVVVRSINVEPIAERQGNHSVRTNWGRSIEATADGFEPLVSPADSDFVVTLDYVRLLSEPDEIGLSEADAAINGGTADAAASPEPLGASPAWLHWPVPQPQPRGAQWIYELFTAPEIFYHAASQQFHRPSPPSAGVLARDAVAPAAPAGLSPDHTLRLLAVRLEDYPLQLVGYLGEELGGVLLGIFENKQSGETLLLGPTDEVEPLGIEVLQLQLEHASKETVTKGGEGHMMPPPLRAVARIRDPQGARTLYEGERATGSALVAQVERDGEVRELREGESWENADGLLLGVETIKAEPLPRVLLKYYRPDSPPLEALWLELDSP